VDSDNLVDRWLKRGAVHSGGRFSDALAMAWKDLRRAARSVPGGVCRGRKPVDLLAGRWEAFRLFELGTREASLSTNGRSMCTKIYSSVRAHFLNATIVEVTHANPEPGQARSPTALGGRVVTL